MPTRGTRPVRQFRGVIRADLRGTERYLTFVIQRDQKKPFLTHVQRDQLSVALLTTQQLLTQMILV